MGANGNISCLETDKFILLCFLLLALYMSMFVYMLFVILTAYTVLAADSNSKNHRIFYVLVNGHFLFCHGKIK